MLIISAITQDRLNRVIKVNIDGINREAEEIWNILNSQLDTAGIICGSDTVEVTASQSATRKFLRAVGTQVLSCPMEELPPAPLQMLVFGDSIAWGQGLRRADKYSTLVGERLSTNNRNVAVTVRNFANSGAIIGNAPAINTSSGFGVRLNSAGENTIGEVPASTPVHSQIDAFLSSGANPDMIDFILLSAGANDILIKKNVMTYLNRSSAITDIVTTGIYFRRMPKLLERMLTVFRNARIIVTSYYPIVTASSRPGSPPEMAIAVAYLSESDPSPDIVFSGRARTNMINNCTTFATTHLTTLTTMVNNINAATPSGFGPRLFIASPTFLPIHGLFGPARSTQLWKPNWTGLSNDDMRRARKSLCNAAFPGHNEGNRNCMGAAVGHPNKKGARAYFDAISSLL